MRFTTRHLLTGIAVVAVTCALPVALRRTSERGVRIVSDIQNKYRITAVVYDLAHAPRASVGYYHVENDRAVFPDLTVWREDATPRWLSFLPISARNYCFSPVKSATCDLDVVSDRAFDELMTIRSLHTVSIHGKRCEQIDLRVIQARYPNTRIVVSKVSFMQPLGARSKGS